MIQEKGFVLRSAIPELATNGKVAVYSTLDVRVNHLIILNKTFQWPHRKDTEVFRCPICRHFILPYEEHSLCRKEEKPC